MKSSILYLHSPTVWPKYIVRLSEDPLIQDSLRRGEEEAPLVADDVTIDVDEDDNDTQQYLNTGAYD